MKTGISVFLLSASTSVSTWAHNAPALEFIENNGQWEEQVEFKAPLWNGAIFLEENQITYSFFHAEDWKKTHDFSQMTTEEQLSFTMRRHSWHMSFEGASTPQLAGAQKQSHYYNYFIGNDPSRWSARTGVYHAVNYSGLYPGIDLRAYDNSAASFKYDFIVHPSGNPSVISLKFSGLDGIKLLDGKIMLATSVGEFIENTPYAFQIINNKMVDVACRYVLTGNAVSFEFPDGYNADFDLVIDPELIAATLSGSTVTNYGHTATFDIEGNIYTGCISFGVGYPTTDGAVQENYGGGFGVDFGLSKLDPEGVNLIWASYLGGSGGDYPHSLYANDFGELYVYGSSDSSNFPTSPDAYDTSNNGGADIIVAHLSEDGTVLIGSTYLGGSAQDGRNQSAVNYGDTYRGEIILDYNGDPMVASFSVSSNFPVTAGAYQPTNNGGQDAVIFRFNQDLSNLEASTFLGSDSDDSGFGLRQKATGDIYLAGMAGDDNFPVTAGCYQSSFLGDADAWATQMDGFVALFNENFTSLIASTYFGTDDQDEIFFMDLDNDENVFIYGQGGATIPIVGDVYSNPGSLQFVSRLTPDLTTLTLSTQIGTGGTGWGGFDFVPIAFLVDHCNNVYISGHGCYGEVPLTADALYGVGQGGFYLAVFNEDMVDLEYGTMYTEGHVDGGTSRFDKNGTVYQGVCSGGGFATTADAWATNQIGGWDIGVFKIDFDVSGVNSAITGSDVSGCAPFEVQFENYSSGDIFLWDFGDGTTSTDFEPTHIYTEPGLYNVSLIASDSLSCNIADTSYFPISISTPIDYYPSFTYTTDCATLGIYCTNTTGYDFLDYLWDMGDGTIIEDENPIHFYSAPGDYTITLTAIDNGCESDSTITQEITIFNEVVAIIGNDDVVACAPAEIEFENNSGGVTFTWDFGDGSPLAFGTNVSHVYDEPGIFNVILYAAGNADCPGADTAYSTVEIIEQQIIEALFSINQIGACEEMTIEGVNESTGEGLDYLWDFGDGETATEEDAIHWYNEPGTYIITLTISAEACDLEDEYQLPVTVIDELDLQLAPDIPICYYETEITLQAADMGEGVEYLWSTGETTSAIVVDEPGEYTLEVGWNECIAHDTVTVFVMPEHYSEMTIEFCEGINTLLTVPYEGSDSYQWCNGETGMVITVDEGADYCYAYIDSSGCLQEGIIHAIMNDYQATVWIPNSFTPNNDGINDVFLPIGLDVAEYEMNVFNRWGDLIFETDEISQPWDGSYKYGEHFVPDGVYPFVIKYRGECAAEMMREVGHVVIIR